MCVKMVVEDPMPKATARVARMAGPVRHCFTPMNEDTAKSLPQIGVVLIPPGSHGSHTEFYRGRKPEAGCTRETLTGVGDFAFAESCQSSTPSMRVYVKAGRNDVFLVVDMLFQHPLSWAQPVAVALAKAAALKAKKA